MEVEAVHASSWCQEDTALLVKMSAHVHQNLIQQHGREKREEGKVIYISYTWKYRSMAEKKALEAQ